MRKALTQEQKLIQAGRILQFYLHQLAPGDPNARRACELWDEVCQQRAPVVTAGTGRIGTCEWCGCTDHHLVRGECPTCHEKVRQMPVRPRNATPVLTEDL